MRKIALSLLFLCVLCVNAAEEQIETEENLSFENKVNNWLTENNVPAGGIGIIENGKIKYVKVFGELKKGAPAPDNAVFNIASMTKPVVTMLTLKLVEAGKWSLDEPLCHYWVDPDIANNPWHKKLNTRHVLTHQTGFPNWRYLSPDKKLAFDFEPGTQYQYSGEGFEYLRYALERKFNKPIEKLLDSVIFAPLGMKNTGYWGKNANELNYAHFHDAQGNDYGLPYPMVVSAADLLFTSIEDYCKFEIDVINGAGLSATLFDDMIKPHVKMKEHCAKALGWGVITDLPDGEYALEHGGSDPGVKTIAIVLPKSKRGIVVLTNGDNGVSIYNNIIKESIDIGEKILEYMQGSIARKAIVLPDEILERYVGAYLDSYWRKVTITKEDGALIMSGYAMPTEKLFPEAENKFFAKGFGIQYEFINNDSIITISEGKIVCTAKRIKQPPPIKLSSNILERYVGTYVRLDNNNKDGIHITKKGDTLKVFGACPAMEMYPTEKNKFFAEEYGVEVEFISDKYDKVIKMNVIGTGKILCEAKRVD